MTPIRSLAVLAAVALGAGGALAQSAVEGAVKARQSHMSLMAFNVGPLGGMAQGNIPYDAELAAAHAANLAAVASLSHTGYWPEGSARGEIEGTRALPALWENSEDVMAKAAALAEATAALAAVAGTDLAALQGAMGPVGQACGACHQNYRASE